MEVRDRECESWDSDGKEEMLNNGSPASKDLGRRMIKENKMGKEEKLARESSYVQWRNYSNIYSKQFLTINYRMFPLMSHE
jgi:hypothetical protein